MHKKLLVLILVYLTALLMMTFGVETCMADNAFPNDSLVYTKNDTKMVELVTKVSSNTSEASFSRILQIPYVLTDNPKSILLRIFTQDSEEIDLSVTNVLIMIYAIDTIIKSHAKSQTEFHLDIK